MSILRRLIYNVWYFRKPPWDTGISPPELVAFLNAHPPGRALDLGCGTGTNCITLARHGWQVTGIDYALPAILSGRRKARQAGLQIDLQVGDVLYSAIQERSRDLILDMGCFHHLDPTQKQLYINNLKRWLAPQGFFMLYGFLKSENDPASIGIDPQDLTALSDQLELIHRQDGNDRMRRASTWLSFQRTT
jgi:cyclopropane fatty-acyl-phospholipid synthase-like methyltransferase